MAAAAPFEIALKVRFQHCDPAGIVFYPRYFEMLNLTIERWFDEALSRPFGALHMEERLGVPTVRTEVDFRAPSRVGETLRLVLEVLELRRSAFVLSLRAVGPDGAERLRARHTLAWVGLSPLGPKPIPDDMRARMARFMAPAAET